MMHRTTVRFRRELWEELAVAADDAGVSLAAYVRQAAVARLAHCGGGRERDASGVGVAEGAGTRRAPRERWRDRGCQGAPCASRAGEH